MAKHNQSQSSGKNWVAVSKQNLCPKCGKPDNCKISSDGKKVWCGRVKSKRRNKGGQWLHNLDKKMTSVSRKIPKKESREESTDWAADAEQFASHANMQRRKLVKILGVSLMVVRSLCVGWDGSAWTFPERDASGNIIGILRRFPSGKKYATKGSKRGIIYSTDWLKPEGPIILVEGSSDTAAGMTLGLSTIGRPTARGGVKFISKLLSDLGGDRQIIVIGENDLKDDGSWPGREGAIATAKSLSKALGRRIDWALPPDNAKDLREWLKENGKDSDRFISALEIQTIDATKDVVDEESLSGSHATTLVQLVTESGAELFHSPDREAFISLEVGNHKETYRLRGAAFQQYLQKLSWDEMRTAVSSKAVEQAMGVLSGMAIYDGKMIETFVRIAEWGGDIWVDLVDDEWLAVRVTSGYWEIVTNSPVRFIRNDGMRPLPVPLDGGSLSEFREFLNVTSDADWTLIQAWLVSCFHPTGPYPLLALSGEQGSSKSTTSRMLRRLIDPSKSPIRSTPREIRDLMIAASNSWLLVFDNLSHIREWLSDSLCRLSTGGGFSTRALYSNDGEKIFDVQRPMLINGITELSNRSDLRDRTIPICLPTLSAKKHKTERELWDQFNAACPRIFGSVLTAVSTAIRNERSVKLTHPPRMEDFAKWVVAAEPALDCVQGDFIAAYQVNRKQSSETAIDVAVIGEPILKLIETEGSFQGSATELLKKLDRITSIGIGHRKPKGWPQQPNSLSSQLRRLIPNLRAVGIEVVMDQRDPKTRTKIIHIYRVTPKKKKMKVKKRKGGTKDGIDR